MATSRSIAIIGAGLSGLRLAQHLHPVADVTVFEKSRGLGGRMSTRRADPYHFDHGAQYFTARGPAFAAFLRPYLEAGSVEIWQPRLANLADGTPPPVWSAPRYVAVPGMTGLAKSMAQDLKVERSVHIDCLQRSGSSWALRDKEGIIRDGFDWVISTAPAPQTAQLMPPEFAGHTALQSTQMQGCYTLMLGFDKAQGLDWDAAWVGADPLAWIAVNASKPERAGPYCIVAQTSNSWAEVNLERDQADVQAELMAAFTAATGVNASSASYVSLHRWRYASVRRSAGHPFLMDPAQCLAAAGDWCGAGKVEAAFESAEALASALRVHLA